MKTQFLSLFLLLGFSLSSFAQDCSELARELYPDSSLEQDYTKTFFDILKQHNSGNDPLLGGKGPSIHSFQIDKMKFAFMRNIKKNSVDLVFFNWDLEVFEGLEKDEELSSRYGKPVYVLKSLDPKFIASQGENGDLLTNFSYLLGANSFAESIRVKYPGVRITDEQANWKPHANYMDRTHPLRIALNAQTLVLLSPDENLFYAQAGDSVEAKEYMRADMESRGGFKKIMIGTSVHEMFHVKEGQDQTLGLIKERAIGGKVNREKLANELDEPKLRGLLSSYTAIVFKLGNLLHEGEGTKDLLGKLATIIEELKNQYPNAWKYLWNYEYTEGFAEYASAQSLIDAKLYTLREKIEAEIKDTNNNIAYRTGTLGGLYLRNKILKLPFSEYEDHKMSVWEIIISKEGVNKSSSIDEITQNYGLPEDELKAELDSIKEYLVSTIVKD